MGRQVSDKGISEAVRLPAPFANWFSSKGWLPRPHQVSVLEKGLERKSTLLIAPTGAGKTLSGFLPGLVDLYHRPKHRPGTIRPGIHTLYISPLKALAVDIERNLATPVREMGLDVSLETRTGDTPSHKRQRQKLNPPDILLTTPEQLALLIAQKEPQRFFSDLRYVIFDELHSLVTSKRGDLLSLGLARLRTFCPGLTSIGLSATVANPDDLRRWLVAQDGQTGDDAPKAELVTVSGGAKPDIAVLQSEDRIPWSGHSAQYAMPELYEAIKAHQMALIFVNTRSQAEFLFQSLWHQNEDALPIALHHGSLEVDQRRRVEAAMVAGTLRAVVATSTLDLGIDWGGVDLVIHVGAPKGASRLAQRIGRANHRMDEPSKAILVPANRFEVMECRAALDANYLGDQDTPPLRDGALDVLAQHILGVACGLPFLEDDLYHEIKSAAPYAWLTRELFGKALSFVSTGGYALKSYERYSRIRKTEDGTWRVRNAQIAQQYRLNAGTIYEAPVMAVRQTKRRANGPARGGRVLGKVEEYFIETLSPGDTFMFAGKILKFEGIQENEAIVSLSNDTQPKIPAYAGGKFPLSTYLAEKVREMLADPERWGSLPEQVRDWLDIQRIRSVIPKREQLLVETFPRGDRFYMVLYPFEGRLAHQTLGMLLTRRLERLGARPLGFVASDYALMIWALHDMGQMVASRRISIDALFDEDMLGDDLDAWLGESYLLKRTFRYCALIAGLVEKRHPGQEKSGRQMTVSSDLIYDVLKDHEPDHLLMQATWHDASAGLLDVERLGAMLSRIRGRIIHQTLDRVSPLAVPVMLEIGKEPVPGNANEALLAEAEEDLLADALFTEASC